jgi:hypothetical protein
MSVTEDWATELRCAFKAGARWANNWVPIPEDNIDAEARLRYPLVVIQVNTMADPDGLPYEFGVLNGVLSARWTWNTGERGIWYSHQQYGLRPVWMPTEARIAVWHELFANPTKVVEK